MFDLDALKRSLKHLVGKCQHEVLFHLLLSEVLIYGSVRDRARVLGLICSIARDLAKRGIGLDEKRLYYQPENEVLIDLIEKIQSADLSDDFLKGSESRKFIPLHEALTCDRTPHSDQFDKLCYTYTEQPQKKSFFFLLGDVKQAHQSLIKRFGHEIGGMPFDFDQKEKDKSLSGGKKWAFVELIPNPTTTGDEDALLTKLLHETFSKFSVHPPRYGLRRQTLSALFQGSHLSRYTTEDSIFVLVTIDISLWNPVVVRRFIEDFCAPALPDDAPDFFFFFGIRYAQGETKANNEVRNALQQHLPIYADAEKNLLPNLDPVSLKEVSRWFTRHRSLIPEGKTDEGMTTALFPGETQKDMADIETTLTELIKFHNKWHVLRAENLK